MSIKTLKKIDIFEDFLVQGLAAEQRLAEGVAEHLVHTLSADLRTWRGHRFREGLYMGPHVAECSVIARSWVMLALEPRQARKGATVVVFGRCLGHLAITVHSLDGILPGSFSFVILRFPLIQE